jgi:hypothetical protein
VPESMRPGGTMPAERIRPTRLTAQPLQVGWGYIGLDSTGAFVWPVNETCLVSRPPCFPEKHCTVGQGSGK